MYQHHNWQGALLDYPVSKVVCVGSNYAKHILEMGNATPVEPVIFIKPETALCDIRQPLSIPKDLGAVHHEVELAVLIGSPLKQATEESIAKAIAGLWRCAGFDAARYSGRVQESWPAMGKSKSI